MMVKVSPDISKMIGEPFLKKVVLSTDEKTKTPAEGMGLGLFIANILLEKLNTKLKFSNVSQIEDNGKKRIKVQKLRYYGKVIYRSLTTRQGEKVKETQGMLADPNTILESLI